MDNPWLDRRVLHYAHQGGAREAPSSTLYALRRARSLGAHALELDVHRTRDGHLVVCHDATLDRTTPRHARIADLSLGEIRELDNAYWWAPGHEAIVGLDDHAYPLRGRFPADTSLGVATLVEVLDEFPDLFLNFDIKETAPVVVPYEAALADALRAYERADDVIVASFHDEALHAFRTAAPEIHTSLGIGEALTAVGQLTAGRLAAREASEVALQIPRSYGAFEVTGALVDAAHASGFAVHIWTIDDAAEMAELVELGVDAIMTDCPSVLAGVLEAFPQGVRPA